MNNTNDRALKTRKGMAIKGLKAWIKALELNENVRVSQQKYRYEIAEDGSRARIFLSANSETVEGTDRSLEDWANIGRPARLALIGLRYTKDQLELGGDRVQYTMNVITGEAILARNGQNLSDQPTTIDGWADLAKPIEKTKFESLRMAQEWGNKDAEDSVIAEMVRWGIIRPRKPGSDDQGN